MRDRNKRVEQDVPQDKIVSRIERGKYTGNEEVAELPDGEWQKLSSVPLFYDALMRRLFQANYKSGGSIAEKATVHKNPPKEKAENEAGADDAVESPDATHQATLHKKEALDAPKADEKKTKQLVGDFEGTIDQALLKELFDEKTGKEGGTASNALTTVLPPKDPFEQPLKESPRYFKKFDLKNPLDIFRPKEGEEGQIRLDNKKARMRRRAILWGSVGFALVLLFWSSSPKQPEVNSPFENEAAAFFGIEPEKKQEAVTALLNEGKQLYGLDNFISYRRAGHLFAQANFSNKSDAQSYVLYAQAYARLAGVNPEEVAELPEFGTLSIERALGDGRALDPQNSGFFRAEAILLMGEKKWEEARKKISEAIDADPEGPENALVLGEITYGLKDFRIAKEALARALGDSMTRVRARLILARIAFESQSYRECEQRLGEIFEINPFHFEGYVLAGDLAAKENKVQQALRSYRQAARLAQFGRPQEAVYAFLKLGKLLTYMSQKGEAEDNFLLAYAADPNNAEAIELTKNLDRSEKILDSLKEKRVTNASQLVIRGETFFKEKDFENAFRYFQAAWVLSNRDHSLLIRLGDIVEKKAVFFTDFIRVRSFYEQAILLKPSSYEAFIKLGLLETQHYNFEKGHRLLSQAKALAPQNRDALVAMGRHYYLRQDYNRAIDEFLEASRLNEEDSEVLYYAGKMRVLFSRDPKAAMTLFERSYKIDPTNYPALAEWLKLKVITFDKPFAIKFVNNLIEAEPTNPKFYWILGEVHAANQDYESAIDNFYKSLDINNRDSAVRMSLARSHDELGEKKKAVAEYTLASRLDRTNAEGFSRAAEILIESGNAAEAEEVLNSLVEVSPRYPGAQRALSQVYEAKKKPDEAERAMLLEVTNNPANAKFRIELAELYMRHEKYEPAIEQLNEITNLPSVAEAPEFVYDKIRAYMLLSRSYRELKQYDSAEGAIQLALSIDEGDPALLRELGYVYVGLQRNKDAASAFRGYLQRSPAAEDAEQIKNMIDNLVIPE